MALIGGLKRATKLTKDCDWRTGYTSWPKDLLISSVLLLAASGTVMVFSASAFHWSVGGDAYFFLRRHLAWLALAGLGCFVFSRLNLHLLQKYYWHLLLLSIALLAVVLIPQVGRNVNASRRWLPIGWGLQFQPSELAKLSAIVFVAGFLSADPDRGKKFFRGFCVVCLAVLPVFLLILAEPDFGSAVFVLGLAFFVLLLGGVRIFHLVVSAAVFLPLIAAFAYSRWDLVQKRLLGFLDPDGLYQVRQSLTALGSGHLTGVGLGASGQKLHFLPEPHTDFVFAIVGEELGFLGAMGIVCLFLLLLWAGVGIVWRSQGLFRFLVGSGIVVALAFQAAYNVAVVTGCAPTKGIPLPFLTFGGSGLCVTFTQIGVLLAVDRDNREDLRNRQEGLEPVGDGSQGPSTEDSA